MKTSHFQTGREVKIEDTIDSVKQCPICLSLKERTAKMIIQNNPLIELLYCETCRGFSASHMPTDELMQEYYADYYKNNESMITFHNADRFANHILGYVKNNFYKNKISILDFGGGDGQISKKIAQKLINTGKIKYAEVMLVDYARENIHKNHYGKIKFEFVEKLQNLSKKYDIVLVGRQNPVLLEYLNIYLQNNTNIEYLYRKKIEGELYRYFG